MAPSRSVRKHRRSPSGCAITACGRRDSFSRIIPRELAISEAAALAGADAIQFRIDHATEERAIGVLKAVRDASGWETRPSPRSQCCRQPATTPVRGRGVSVMFRSGTYWACVCEIAVTPGTGVIKVEKYTIAVDPGIVVNPLQLKRQVEGGAVMGISHALLEEAKFDESGDHRSRLADVPDPEDGRYSRDQSGAAQPARGGRLRRRIGGRECPGRARHRGGAL